MANVQDLNIVINEFEPKSLNYVYLRTINIGKAWTHLFLQL